MYLDNVSDPLKPVTREIKRFFDDPYWCKPDTISGILVLENQGDDTLNFILEPQMYFLLEPDQEAKCAPITSKFKELKSAFNEPLWVWNRAFCAGGYQKILPKQKLVLHINDLFIENMISPFEYFLNAIAIKVIIKLENKKYSNVSIEQFIDYGH
jgi:hypothetical protein